MFATVEKAIIARLQAASDADVLGYRYKSLETYPENWDAYLKAKRPTDFPGAWAVFAGFRDAQEWADGMVHVMASFGLVVAARNLRNEAATRHGGAAGEPGSYQLMTDAIALLSGHNLDLDIDRIKIRSASQVRPIEGMQSLTLSAWAIELSIGMAIPGDASFGNTALDDFQAFHANWDIAPFVPITAVPADAAADATDHITLPIQEEAP